MTRRQADFCIQASRLKTSSATGTAGWATNRQVRTMHSVSAISRRSPLIAQDHPTNDCGAAGPPQARQLGRARFAFLSGRCRALLTVIPPGANGRRTGETSG